MKRRPRSDAAVNFAATLSSVIQMRGITQVQLAAMCHLPAASISHFESGRRLPSFDNLRTLAVALDVSTDDLLGLPSREARARESLLDDLQRHVAKIDAIIEELGGPANA